MKQGDWAGFQTEEKLPRDIEIGDRVWIYLGGTWGWFAVTGKDKTAQKRATHKSMGRPCRYLVTFEGETAPRTWPPADKLRVRIGE